MIAHTWYWRIPRLTLAYPSPLRPSPPMALVFTLLLASLFPIPNPDRLPPPPAVLLLPDVKSWKDMIMIVTGASERNDFSTVLGVSFLTFLGSIRDQDCWSGKSSDFIFWESGNGSRNSKCQKSQTRQGLTWRLDSPLNQASKRNFRKTPERPPVLWRQ